MDQQEPFFHDLKQLRVAQGITLADISSKTRINQRFLEALEAGEFTFLPHTYIRLFLRSYCQEIGSNFEEVAQQLETYLGNTATLPSMLEGDEKIDVTALQQVGESDLDRSPATLRRDFITGAVIFVSLVVITIFARRAYLNPEEVATAQPAAVRTETPAPRPEPSVAEPAQTASPPARSLTVAPNTRPVVPVESTLELEDRLFAQDRLVAHLLERVRLTPPVRLTLMSRDNIVLQPYSNGKAATAFNLTVAEARQWTIKEVLVLRTPSIHLLRGDLNGVPIDFGEATGLGILRVTPSGVYEVFGYAAPE